MRVMYDSADLDRVSMTAARKPRRRQRGTQDRMSDEAFADLKVALEDALAYERGTHRELVVTRIEKPRATKAGSDEERTIKAGS